MAELTDEQIENGWWDIAKVGSWSGSSSGKAKKIKITQEDIEAMAADYGPDKQEAPLTIEHEQSGPALGWVKALRVAGDTLQAQFTKMSGALKDWLKTGAYRTRSIEFYNPFSETKQAYLAAVTFLGAAAPAVKGLNPEPVEFRANEPRFNVELPTESEEKPMDELSRAALSRRIIEQVKKCFGTDTPNIQQKEMENMDYKEQLAEQVITNKELVTDNEALKNKLSEETKRADKAENELDTLHKAAEMQDFKAGIDKALAEERILPVDAKQYMALGEKIDDAGRTEILEDISKRTPLKMFKEITAEDKGDKKLTSKTADIRRMAEEDEDPESKREALAAADLMDQNEKLSFTEARKLAIKAEQK